MMCIFSKTTISVFITFYPFIDIAFASNISYASCLSMKYTAYNNYFPWHVNRMPYEKVYAMYFSKFIYVSYLLSLAFERFVLLGQYIQSSFVCHTSLPRFLITSSLPIPCVTLCVVAARLILSDLVGALYAADGKDWLSLSLCFKVP